VPALIDAGVDVVCFDSSDGYTEFQRDAVQWVRKKYGHSIIIGGGNIVDGEAFDYLARMPIWTLSRSHWRRVHLHYPRAEGDRRGQASALIDWWPGATRTIRKPAHTCPYVPTAASQTTPRSSSPLHGRRFRDDGRYFAMTTKAPAQGVAGRTDVQALLGEGSNRARNWQRYNMGTDRHEIRGRHRRYVPVVGSLSDILDITLAKLKSTMCNSGAVTLNQLPTTRWLPGCRNSLH